MSSIHYKFRATVELKTVRFDGLHVLCSDLKRRIYSNENIKVESFDLILTNAQTKRSYVDNEPVPRNTTIIVQRVPKEGAEKAPKIPKGNGGLIVKSSSSDGLAVNPNVIGHLDQADLDNMTEEERQAHVMAVSTSKYDQSNYVKRTRNTIMSGPPPPTYLCNRCNQTGHWYQNCPMANTRKATGMTMDELLVTTADDPHALLHSSGRYVVPKMHHLARQQQKRSSVEAPEMKASPEDIVQRVRIGFGSTVPLVQPAICFPGSTSQLTQITDGGFHQLPPVLLDTSVPPPNFTITPTLMHMTLPSSAVPMFNMSVPPPGINLYTPNYANFGAQHGHYMGHTTVKQELPPGIDDYCGGLSMDDRRWSTVGSAFSSSNRRRSSHSSRSRSRSPSKRRSRKKDRKHSKEKKAKKSHQSRSSRSERKQRRHHSTSQEDRRKTKKKDRKADDREERKSRRSQESDGGTEDRVQDQDRQKSRHAREDGEHNIKGGVAPEDVKL